jgi:hypothetical protein
MVGDLADSPKNLVESRTPIFFFCEVFSRAVDRLGSRSPLVNSLSLTRSFS